LFERRVISPERLAAYAAILEPIATDWVFSERQNARKGDKPEPALPRSGALKPLGLVGDSQVRYGMTYMNKDGRRCRRGDRVSFPGTARLADCSARAIPVCALSQS